MSFSLIDHVEKYKFLYLALSITIIIIIIILLYNKKRNEKFTNNIYILKYFGSKGCPHSREGSRAYDLVKEFETKYEDKNVKVEYYWSDDKDNKPIFIKANATSVPTLTNNSFKKIELVIPKCNTPDCEDMSNKTEAELKELLLEIIYKKIQT